MAVWKVCNRKPERSVLIFALIASEVYSTLSAIAKTRLFLDLSIFLNEEHEFFLPSPYPQKRKLRIQSNARTRRTLTGFYYPVKCWFVHSLEISQFFPYTDQKPYLLLSCA